MIQGLILFIASFFEVILKIWIWKKTRNLILSRTALSLLFWVILVRWKKCHIFTWHWIWATHQIVSRVSKSQIPNFMNSYSYLFKVHIFCEDILEQCSNFLGRLLQILVVLSLFMKFNFLWNNLICWKMRKFRFRDSSSLQLKCRIELLLWVMLYFCDGKNCHIFTWQWNLRLLSIRLAVIPYSNAWSLASLEGKEFVLSTVLISVIWNEF